ncbi:MAG: DUF167 domain-containing protein [Candidatus Paceibacterota bacterium]
MYIRVRVVAGAKKEVVLRTSETEFVISVKEPARQNLANKRVQGILGETLQIPPRNVRLISGHRSPTKVFSTEL